jgi:hypothetical protein
VFAKEKIMTLVGVQVPKTLAIVSTEFNPGGEGGRNILYKYIYKEETENVPPNSKDQESTSIDYDCPRLFLF